MPDRDPTTGRFPKGNGAGGVGWGGPAKGEGKRVDLAEVRPLRWDPDNLAAKEEVAAQMRGVLYQVAMTGEAEAARINAADKLLDRIEGKARQSVEQSGPGGGPVKTETTVTVRIVRPDNGGESGV